MNSGFMRLVFLLLPLLFLSPRVATAQSAWAIPHLTELRWSSDRISQNRTALSTAEKAAVRKAASKAIRECVADPGPGDPRTAEGLFNSLRVRRVPLNVSGEQGVLVQGNGVCMCGAVGNCSFWLITEKASGYEVVLQTIGIQTFEIEKASSDGYFDVILGGHGSAWETDLSLYHYTGKYYRRGACALLSYQGDHFESLKVPKITPEPCRGR